MQPPTVREVIDRLRSEGWEHVRTSGDHRMFSKGGRLVVVSGKMGDHLARGTYSNIRRMAGW